MEGRKEWEDATRRVTNFLPDIRIYWPEEKAASFCKEGFLSYGERLGLSVFLFGNGVSGSDILTLLLPKMKDESAKTHLRSLVKDLTEAKYGARWFYFDVHFQDVYYLNGTPKGEAKGRFAFTRRMNEWEAFVDERVRKGRGYPSLSEQEAFFCRK